MKLTRPTRRMERRLARCLPLARGAFTLIELILVMTMLLIAVGVSIPTLKRFFQGRNIDSEARRFLSLTRYGQSRAVAEGVPMILWIDARQKAYGLQVQTGYLQDDTNSVRYTLDKSLEIEAQLPATTRTIPWKPTTPGIGNVPMIRFMPDGAISETSPDRIVIRQGTAEEIWITGNTNRLSYAIHTNIVRLAQR